jgi:hypothetical protein
VGRIFLSMSVSIEDEHPKNVEITMRNNNFVNACYLDDALLSHVLVTRNIISDSWDTNGGGEEKIFFFSPRSV